MIVHPSPASAPVNASPKSVRRESKASNRSIKKIQVTIIFDGAEELVIDARLQRKGDSGDWRTLHRLHRGHDKGLFAFMLSRDRT